MVAVTALTVTIMRDGLADKVSKDRVVRAPYPIRQDNGEATENMQLNTADITTPDEQPPSARRLMGSTRDAVLYPANKAVDTQAQPAIIRVPKRSGRESTAIKSSSVLDGDEDTAVPSTAPEEDPSPVLNEHVEDQVDAEDAAHLDLRDEVDTPASDTVQPSTALEYHDSTDTEADQSAMDGAVPSANRQNISDISDGPEPSRIFSRMRKNRSLHYAFDKIVAHDVTGPGPVYKIRWTSLPSSEDTWESTWNIPYNAVARYHRRNGLDTPHFYKYPRQK